MPQLSVATEIQLAGAQTTDRHANPLQVIARIPCRLTPFEQRLNPFGTQFFVGWYQLLEVAFLERPSHRGPGGNPQCNGAGGRPAEQIASRYLAMTVA